MIHEQWQQYLQHAADRRGEPSGGTAAGGLAYLPELVAVRFEGSDARNFLQGYLTSDTGDLRPGRLTATALCNLKGRVVMNGWCAPDGDEDVLLILHASLVETLGEFLRPYLMFSRKTALKVLRDEMLLLGGLDLQPAGDDPPGLELDARRRLFPLDEPAARRLWERHTHLGSDDWLASLAEDGLPLITAPVSATFLPQMLDLDALGAIDFEKGCYLGQEVVARAQHRGQVKRRLARLRWEGAQPPPPGAEITDKEGRNQGVVLQSGAARNGGGALLAVLREQAPDALHQGETELRRAS